MSTFFRQPFNHGRGRRNHKHRRFVRQQERLRNWVHDRPARVSLPTAPIEQLLREELVELGSDITKAKAKSIRTQVVNERKRLLQSLALIPVVLMDDFAATGHVVSKTPRGVVSVPPTNESNYPASFGWGYAS